ncbi:MAG: GDP-mannose 4,6-dehydratase, partial [Candidatus Cloacimonetes bacterium]|nr:GDP-mannose 4,6-dehydratase [Candidatus Cloacimonadota bacterium]
MKTILITGAAGQIGSELTPALRKVYGNDNVVASDIRADVKEELKTDGPYEVIDCLDVKRIADIVKKYNIDTIYNLAALL